MSDKPGDGWAQHETFLKEPLTILRVIGLADMLEIFQVGLNANQGGNPLEAGATDTAASIATMRAELQGYILTTTTERQQQEMSRDGELVSDNNIVRRAMVDGRLALGRWHI